MNFIFDMVGDVKSVSQRQYTAANGALKTIATIIVTDGVNRFGDEELGALSYSPTPETPAEAVRVGQRYVFRCAIGARRKQYNGQDFWDTTLRCVRLAPVPQNTPPQNMLSQLFSQPQQFQPQPQYSPNQGQQYAQQMQTPPQQYQAPQGVTPQMARQMGQNPYTGQEPYTPQQVQQQYEAAVSSVPGQGNVPF